MMALSRPKSVYCLVPDRQVKERRVTGRKFRYLLTDIRLRFGRLPQVALPLNYWQRSAFKAFLFDSNSAQSL